MIKIRCPHCQTILMAEEENSGQHKRCPACQRHIVIPDVSRLTATQLLEPIRAEEIPDMAPVTTGATPKKVSLVQRFSNLNVLVRVAVVLAVLVVPLAALVISKLYTQHTEATKPPPPPTPTPISMRTIVRPKAEAGVLALVQAKDWNARQSGIETLVALGPDALESVRTALQEGHLTDRFGRRIDLSAAQRGDLLRVLWEWSRQARLPDSVNPVAQSLFHLPETRMKSALLLGFQGDPAAAPVLSQELLLRVRRSGFLQTRIQEGLENNQQAAEELLGTDKRELAELRSALARIGPAAWPTLLEPFWSTWPWIGSQQGNYYLAELDHIRTSSYSDSTQVRAKLNEFVKNAPAALALPAAAYIAHFEEPEYDRNRELAGWLVNMLSERNRLTVQRTVWVIARLIHRQFYKFEDDQLPLQAGEQAMKACRDWAESSFGSVAPRPTTQP